MTAYRGPRRKLVLAFDVGTTFSGISYALLDPGQVPRIQGVTRFPGQENVAGDAKIPSILYYDHHGDLCAAGAEAQLPSIMVQAEDEGWTLVEWFKLHLRPDSLDTQDLNKRHIPPLPRGKGVIDVFADFLGYLFDCARQYIAETHMNGRQLWSSAQDEIEFILSHPNGWEGVQQHQMRRAAVGGGLIRDHVSGHSRIHFVTEGEASLQFCIRNGLDIGRLAAGDSIMVIDAGGGTVDVSSYAISDVKPLSVEEVTSPDCLLQGSVAVNTRAYNYLKTLLRNSQYGSEDDIKEMRDSFDKATKPTFKDPSESSYIKFGSMRCNDPVFNIRRGQLSLSGNTMLSLFEPSIRAIVDSVDRQRRMSSRPIRVAFLVGGFAASPWLYRRLEEALGRWGMDLCRPEAHTSKAVAEGAASYYLQHNVTIRVARTTYGVDVNEPYNGGDVEHVRRRQQVIERPSGRLVIPGAYSVLLSKGSRMREADEVSVLYRLESGQPSELDHITTEIKCYRGPNVNPLWKDMEAPGHFSTLCTIRADTSGVRKLPQHGTNGYYYVQNYNVILLCGLTELKAQISWVDNGVEKRGPAEIIYEDME